MASFFISHSRDGIDAAEVIQRHLRQHKYPAAFLDFDPEHGIHAGALWERELYEQIASVDAVLFLSTPQSRASRWCFAELTIARALNKRIFPVNVAGAIGHELLNEFQWIDYASDGPKALERLVVALTDAGFAADSLFEPDPSRPPYPGLGSFEAADAAMFFGRDDAIRSLQRRLENSDTRWLAVIGPSGSGKSSLVKGGLVPRLAQKRGWKVIEPFTPTHSPLSALARALAVTTGDITKRPSFESMLRTDPAQFVELLRDIGAAQPTQPLLAVVDQAEQLLRLPASTERIALLSTLLSALRDVPTFRLVWIMRSDFLTDALVVEELATHFDQPMTVTAIDRSRLRELIVGPATRARIRIAEEVVNRLISETPSGDALPLLAHSLREMWERTVNRPNRSIGLEDYDAVGGVTGALETQANRTFNELKAKGLEQHVFRTLLAMVTADDQSRPVRVALPIDHLAPEERIVIQAFVDARLVVARDDRTVEIIHDALLRVWKPLRTAIESQGPFLTWRSNVARAAREWIASGHDDPLHRTEEDLLRGARLAEAQMWLERRPAEDIPSNIRRYVEASSAATEANLAVPRIFSWAIPLPEFRRAAIVRDALLAERVKTGQMSRFDADVVFRRLLESEGATFTEQWFAFGAVRIGALLTVKSGREFLEWLRHPEVLLVTTSIGVVVLPPAILVKVAQAIGYLGIDLPTYLIVKVRHQVLRVSGITVKDPPFPRFPFL